MPDSDDEEIIDIDDVATKQTSVQAKKRKEESNMQKWIKHLSTLLKEEQRRLEREREEREREERRRQKAAAKVCLSAFNRSVLHDRRTG